MKPIYEPRGRAREYSPLALNLYTGCEHKCKYCYAPAISRKTIEQAAINVQPRKDILKYLEKQAATLIPTNKRILLSFMNDPYSPIEKKEKITMQALEILGKYGHKSTILTKNGKLASRDFDLMKKYDVHYGVTLCWSKDKNRKEWEPKAGTVKERLDSLYLAKSMGIYTWVSLEPVIVTKEALDVIKLLKDKVNMIKIGKINHNKQIENSIDWKLFLNDSIKILKTGKSKYYIKKDLLKYNKK